MESHIPKPSAGEEDAGSYSRARMEKVEPAPQVSHLFDKAPGASPRPSGAGSAVETVNSSRHTQARKPFRSRRIKKGEAEMPWLKTKDPREKWVNIIPLVGLFVGIGIAGFMVWTGIRQVTNFKYCPVLLEDFSHGLDPKMWTKEVEVGGFGNGQFEQTTGTEENVFVKDGNLWIKPSLQDEKLVDSNSVIDLLADKTCTSNTWYNCVASTNTTNGTIVNPVKSARINTKQGAKIRFGRVEVVAKLPAGDWLWPAIWMMPVNQTYGEWPKSGEIDLAESRGNNYTYSDGGNNVAGSALHWGPNLDQDAWWRTNNNRKALHSTYSKSFHTFSVEWSEKYLFMYIDSRLNQVMYVKFDEPFWQRGHFPPGDGNGTRFVDPWSQTGRYSTPFDQDFYLILNVAVGGTNSWFKDGLAGKPWVDLSKTAKKEFWDARKQWYPTWEPEGQMIVKSVKMWQQAGYNGCN